MGIRPAATAIFALALGVALVLGNVACGRRGAPLRPDAKSADQTLLHISDVARMGDLAVFNADATGSIVVDLVRVADYTCGPAEPPIFFSASAATDLVPAWLALSLPDSEPAYLRARDSFGRESAWFYLAPATATPPTPALVVEQFAGFVTLAAVPDNMQFRLEQKLGDRWLNYGLSQTSVTRGPFPPGERLEFRLFFARRFHNGWAYSRQPAIATPIIK